MRQHEYKKEIKLKDERIFISIYRDSNLIYHDYLTPTKLNLFDYIFKGITSQREVLFKKAHQIADGCIRQLKMYEVLLEEDSN